MEPAHFLSKIYSLIFISLLVASSSISQVHSDSGNEVMCFQGTLVTDKYNKISLSPESLASFQIRACMPPTTTAQPEPSTAPGMTTAISIETTELGTAPNEGTTAPNTEVGAPSTSNTVNPASTSEASTDANSAVPGVDTSTSAPGLATGETSNSTLPPTDQTPQRDNTSLARRRREAEPTPDPEYYCHITYGLTGGDSGKLKVNSTYTLEFTCRAEADTDETCKNNKTSRNETGDVVTYCCQGDSCNTPLTVVKDKETTVGFATVSDCNHYDESGTTPVPCIPGGDAYFCLNQTNNAGDQLLSCAYKRLQETYCLSTDTNWFKLDECSHDKEGTMTCCYYPEAAPAPAPSLKPSEEPPAKHDPAHGSAVGGIIVAVVVSLVTGIFVGCVLLVVLQKKCRKRTGGDDLMDFSYSRFQSAENSTNEL